MKLKNIRLKDIRKIKKIIVHCSDSPDKLDIGVEDIKKWHLDRNFSDIGYHYVVRRNGDIEEGRALIRPGAHTQGHNHDSVGVCWVGRDKFKRNQYKSLIDLLGKLLLVFKLDIVNIFGHNSFNENKTCPNIDVLQLQEDVQKWLNSQN